MCKLILTSLGSSDDPTSSCAFSSAGASGAAVVVVAAAPGRPLRLILGPGRRGLTLLPPAAGRNFGFAVVLLAASECPSSSEGLSPSVGAAVVLRPRPLTLKPGRGRLTAGFEVELLPSSAACSPDDSVVDGLTRLPPKRDLGVGYKKANKTEE